MSTFRPVAKRPVSAMSEGTIRFQKEANELLEAFRKDTREIVERATRQMQAIEAEYAAKAQRRRNKTSHASTKKPRLS
jgi:hypothetical protein